MRTHRQQRTLAPLLAIVSSAALLSLTLPACHRSSGSDGAGGAGGAGGSGGAGGTGGSGGDNGGCNEHQEGCSCSTPGATMVCFTGPASDRNRGMCKDGMQTCQALGELSSAWGACEGQVLDCGTGGGGETFSGNECGQIAVGIGVVCKITATGGVKCAHTVPAPDPPALTDTRCITAGENGMCALSTAGAVRCWPAQGDAPVAGLESGVAEVAAGENHVCARMTSGAVKCFGESGELNSPEKGGSYKFPATPTDVAGLGNDVKAVASGDGFSCALLGSGKVQCWGNNVQGELGNGTTTDSATPVDVKLPAPAVALSVSAATLACAVLQTGRVMCWGTVERGHAATSTPVEIAGFGMDIVALTTGGEDALVCAVLRSGAVQCRGFGVLGDGSNMLEGSAPVNVKGIATATEVKSNDIATCARLANGSVQCWGIVPSMMSIPGLDCNVPSGGEMACMAWAPYDVGL